jgi:hypothetical protein
LIPQRTTGTLIRGSKSLVPCLNFSEDVFTNLFKGTDPPPTAATVSVSSASSHGCASNTPSETAAYTHATLAAASLEQTVLHSTCFPLFAVFLAIGDVLEERSTCTHTVCLCVTRVRSGTKAAACLFCSCQRRKDDHVALRPTIDESYPIKPLTSPAHPQLLCNLFRP